MSTTPLASSDSAPTPPSPPPSLPLITDLSHCAPPVRKIFTDQDIPNWLDSEAYDYIETLILRLSAAVEGKTVEDTCVESEVSRSLTSGGGVNGSQADETERGALYEGTRMV